MDINYLQSASTNKLSSKFVSMKYINRYAITLFLIFAFYYVFNFFQLISYENTESSPDMIDSFETLKQKITYLQNLVDSKQNDINSLKEAFASNVNYYNNLVEKQKKILESIKNYTFTNYNKVNITDPHHDEQIKILMSKLNIDANKTAVFKSMSNDVEFPQVIEFLPHLTGKTHVVQPKFKLSKNRFASIVIGVPTIKREKTSYLLETLKSLFDAMNDLEKSEALVVVMIAELDDNQFVQDTVKNINLEFKFELDYGLLDIVVPPTEFYPNFNGIDHDRVFNDSFERVKWRTKQNYDFSYLMTYCQKRGVYYLQLEDDVVSKIGFFNTMKTFIKEQKTDQWMMIEFSQLGFIGKLFKCHHLPMFVNFFLMFASDKPVDWLYDSVFSVKICNPEKGDVHCERSKNDLKIKYKPSLFQHVGVQSSLKGKTQKLKDKEFGKQIPIVSHQNPQAKLSTSLKTYMKHTLESAYLGQNFFWSMAPVANDFILFEFDKPITLSRYYVKSGNPEHPDDKLFNATFHIKPVELIPESKVPPDFIRTSDNFYIINSFSNSLGTVSGNIDINIVGKISQIRIHIPQQSENWIIISEIDFSSKQDDRKTLISLLTSGKTNTNEVVIKK